jgi:molybdopterin molybdotransferase
MAEPPLVTVAAHRQRGLAGLRPLPSIEVPLLQALGAVLAEDVLSPAELPGFDNSAMDGYAVFAADIAAASAEQPIVLPVVADLPAGARQRLTLAPGQAMRIMTGAPVPHGAEAIIPVEFTDGGQTAVAIFAGIEVGRHIRIAGTDVRPGDRVLDAGTVVSAGQIALLAAIGRGSVLIIRQPKVVVISTGDELVPPGTAVGFGQVVDSNGVMLAAAASSAGAAVRQVAGVPDDADHFRQVLAAEADRADLLITSGGVSAGAYDTVKEVLAAQGTVWFGKVAMQPGMPQGFGHVGPQRTPIFTLPGNPASAYVSFEVFVRPAIRCLAGHRQTEPVLESVTSLDAWASPAAKEQWARVDVQHGPDGPTLRLAGGQGSSVLGGLGHANALALVPVGVSQVEAGDHIRCLPLADWS